jgi:glycerophosphoryl diester phosphodiesterase
MSRYVWLVLSTWFLGVTALGAAEKFPDTPAGRLCASDRVLIIGHRGNAAHAPENTLVSFQQAVKAGADLVELDYFVTSDGEQVCFHDKDLDRTTDALAVLKKKGLAIADVTLGDLQRLDAGKWNNAKYAGERVPTLAAAIDAINQGSITLIEHKAGSAELCVKLLREKKVAENVVVQSFDWDYIAEMHRIAPEIAVVALGGREFTRGKLEQIEKTGAMGIGWDQRFINKEHITAAHERGYKMWVYTVNPPERAQQLIDAGIDGLITDDPATLLDLRKKRER